LVKDLEIGFGGFSFDASDPFLVRFIMKSFDASSQDMLGMTQLFDINFFWMVARYPPESDPCVSNFSYYERAGKLG